MSHTEKVEFEVPTVDSEWESPEGTARVISAGVVVKYEFTDHESESSWGASNSLKGFTGMYEPAEDKVEAGQTWEYSSSGTEFYVYEVSDVRVFGRATYRDGDPYADDYARTSFQSYWKLKK